MARERVAARDAGRIGRPGHQRPVLRGWHGRVRTASRRVEAGLARASLDQQRPPRPLPRATRLRRPPRLALPPAGVAEVARSGAAAAAGTAPWRRPARVPRHAGARLLDPRHERPAGAHRVDARIDHEPDRHQHGGQHARVGEPAVAHPQPRDAETRPRPRRQRAAARDGSRNSRSTRAGGLAHRSRSTAAPAAATATSAAARPKARRRGPRARSSSGSHGAAAIASAGTAGST